MSSSSSSSATGGIGFFGLLTVLFIGLKLTNFIDWSWFWVLSPIWISGCIGLFFMIVALVIALFVAKEERLLKSHIDRLRK